jgi:hypothetical protein
VAGRRRRDGPARRHSGRGRVHAAHLPLPARLGDEVGAVVEDRRDLLALQLGRAALGDVLQGAEHAPRLAVERVRLADGASPGVVRIQRGLRRVRHRPAGDAPHGADATARARDRPRVVELLLAHSEKSATAAACSHTERAADRKRAWQHSPDRVEALAAGTNVIPRRAA